jgi:hypothetical protein
MALLFLLNDKVEAALAAIVVPAAGDAQVVTGKSAVDKQAPPVVVCSAEAQDMDDPPGSGNYFLNGSVAIKSAAVPNEDGTVAAEDLANVEADIKAANQELVEGVFKAVQVDDLAERLSDEVDGLTVFPGSVQFGAPESGRDEKGFWIDVVHFRCYACASELG